MSNELLDNIVVENERVYDSKCIRQKTNMGKHSSEMFFDDRLFNPNAVLYNLRENSPKLAALLNKIEQLDAADMARDGHKYKHFIFSDVRSNAYGAKMVTSALIARGMNIAYHQAKETKMYKNVETENVVIRLNSDEKLKQTKYNNVLLLSSLSVYESTIKAGIKKEILTLFNRRPDNVHGELARIIVLDGGYKEGIDLFDIKYVHLFEPSVTMADQKQAIGRGTRSCGQKGLKFHPTRGWPLHVFIYDVAVPKKYKGTMLNADTLFDFYMKTMNIDVRRLKLQTEIERVTVEGSVDYELNRNIHHFSSGGPDEDEMLGGAKNKYVNEISNVLASEGEDDKHDRLQRVVAKEYQPYFSWDKVTPENLCKGGSADDATDKALLDLADKTTLMGGATNPNDTIVKHTPTQNFIRNYFLPYLPLKGMLLWHSVGTGKTCTAIATATNSFEKEGYSIIWVTRHTLKSDIWKNMFDMVCSESIKQKIADTGVHLPKSQTERMKLLSKSWAIKPMSYKQFENAVSGGNTIHNRLIKKNGEADPLRRTLVIIDEAHKLASTKGLIGGERCNIEVISQAFQRSYAVSGKDSVRVLLMTATPIMEDAMELVKLINLTKERAHQLPERFEAFAERYLDETGGFTKRGERAYMNDIAGSVSYLNREKDMRQFSQPIIKRMVVAPYDNDSILAKYDLKMERMEQMKEVKKMQDEMDESRKKIEEMENAIGNVSHYSYLKDDCMKLPTGTEKKECLAGVKSQIRELTKSARQDIKSIKKDIQGLRKTLSKKKKDNKMTNRDIRENRKIYEEEYNKLMNTSFYKVNKECVKEVASKDVAAYVKAAPEVMEIQGKIDAQLALKNNMTRDLKEGKKVMQLHLKDIRARLKDKTITEAERADLLAAEQTVQANIKNYVKSDAYKRTRREISMISKGMDEDKTELRSTSRAITRLLKKSAKKRRTERVKERRATRKLEKKQMRLDNKIKRLEEKQKDKELRAEVNAEIKAEKAEAKMQEKEEKKAAKRAETEAKKTQKKAETEAKKAQKKMEAEERREAKKTQKRMETEAKKAQKKAEAEEKRELKKLEMEARRAMKYM